MSAQGALRIENLHPEPTCDCVILILFKFETFCKPPGYTVEIGIDIVKYNIIANCLLLS
jgi:hypothetical protein